MKPKHNWPEIISFVKEHPRQYTAQEISLHFNLPKGTQNEIMKKCSPWLKIIRKRGLYRLNSELIKDALNNLSPITYKKLSEITGIPIKSLRSYICRHPELRNHLVFIKSKPKEVNVVQEVFDLFEKDPTPRTFSEWEDLTGISIHNLKKHLLPYHTKVVQKRPQRTVAYYRKVMAAVGPKTNKEWAKIFNIQRSGVSHLIARNPELKQYLLK